MEFSALQVLCYGDKALALEVFPRGRGGVAAGCGTGPVEGVGFLGPGDVRGGGVNELGFAVGGGGKENVAHCGERAGGKDGGEAGDGVEGGRA